MHFDKKETYSHFSFRENNATCKCCGISNHGFLVTDTLNNVKKNNGLKRNKCILKIKPETGTQKRYLYMAQ